MSDDAQGKRDFAGSFPDGEVCHRLLSSDLQEVRRLQEEIDLRLKELKFSERDRRGIRLALEEALVNAIKHGNRLDQSKKVYVCYCVRPERFDIHIADEGAGFRPEAVPDPTAPENLERPSGRGLVLMRYYMTEVEYNAQGNVVRMSKVRDRSP
ncbi:MAG: ATP-binding protein [Gemmataceae bacterium]|nr:ATP-binding protein [Gemmataceae bacterium]MDW8265738.1 ATP-binding protein [Gemmataceae bacterium]